MTSRPRVHRLMVFVVAVSCLSFVVSRATAAMSPFYVDDGHGRTVGGEIIAEEEMRDISEELLSVMGLHRRPQPPQARTISSASRFLLDVYSQIVDTSTGVVKADSLNAETLSHFNITHGDKQALDASDTIMSFVNYGNPLYKQLPYTPSQLLWFDMIEVPKTERDLTALLRFYQNNSGSSHEQPYNLVVHQIMKGDDGLATLQKLDQVVVAAGNTGWLAINITLAVEKWTLMHDYNLGLFVQVVDGEGAEVTMARAGLVDTLGPEAFQPFLTVFVKTHEVGEARGASAPIHSAIHSRRAKRAANDAKRKVRRLRNSVHPLKHLLSRKHQMCHRQNMYVNFSNLGWGDWIVAPKGYAAFYCAGMCEFPLTSSMNATNHAIVQTLVHLFEPFNYPKPQCTPNELGHLSLLYHDDSDTVILKKYPNMIAVSCGCH